MHAMTMLHRILTQGCAHIHAKRLASLMAAVESAVSGNRLDLSDLGRGIPGAIAVKHNIKRIDRLLGNTQLHDEMASVYAAVVRHCLQGVKTPLIIVDWSDLTPDRHWQLLRASVALAGRSITLYEQVHAQAEATSPAVHAAFMQALAAILPPGCRPVVMTDAGFRSPWFRLVEQLGWHWIGRIRNRDMVRQQGESEWIGAKVLYAKATACAQSLGHYDYVHNRPLACSLVLAKRCSKGRHRRSVYGKLVRSSRSHKHARAEREPWLLAISAGLNALRADDVVNMYAQRMQIEQAFRDIKSERVGLGLNATHSRQAPRLAVLLLIGCLAAFVLRLIGEAAQALQMQRRMQSNTRRSRAVLSMIGLGLIVVRKRLADFTASVLHATLDRLRERLNWVQI